MANYYAAARSNAFEVRDEEAFVSWANGVVGLRVKRREAGRYVLLVEDEDGGGWPSVREDEAGELEEVDLFEELSGHLADGEVAVLEEAGAEKLRYLVGYAVAVNHLGDTLSVSITDIYEKVKEAGWGEAAQATY